MRPLLTLNSSIILLLVLLVSCSLSNHPACMNLICKNGVLPKKNSEMDKKLQFLGQIKDLGCDFTPNQLEYVLDMLVDHFYKGKSENEKSFSELMLFIHDNLIQKVPTTTFEYYNVIHRIGHKINHLYKDKNDFPVYFDAAYR